MQVHLPCRVETSLDSAVPARLLKLLAKNMHATSHLCKSVYTLVFQYSELVQALAEVVIVWALQTASHRALHPEHSRRESMRGCAEQHS